MALRRETLIAVINVANEGLFSGVDALVRLEITLLRKLFSTVRKRTLEGLFTALEAGC